MKKNPDHFNILRKLQSKPNSTQRELAEELEFSLGKLNYCLKALKKKGLIKLKNFQKKTNKINYLGYVTTPKVLPRGPSLQLTSCLCNLFFKYFWMINFGE